MTSVLNALLGWKLSKSFAVPVKLVVRPAEVITSQKPFYDAGASTSQKSTGVSDVSVTSSNHVQATGEVPVKATQPVEAPGTRRGDVIQQNATQPVEAPGAGPKVLLTGTSNNTLHAEKTLTGGKTVESTGGSDSEENLQSEPGSPVDGNFLYVSPDRVLNRNESANQELSEETSYRETIRGVRSFMCWHKIPEFDVVSSSDDNPFPVPESNQLGKSLSNYLWTTGCVGRWKS